VQLAQAQPIFLSVQDQTLLNLKQVNENEAEGVVDALVRVVEAQHFHVQDDPYLQIAWTV
jgi:hypothetical protein